MPIEIRELIVRVRVEDTAPDHTPDGRRPFMETGYGNQALEPGVMNAIVKSCVQQVMENLKRQKER